MKIKTRYLLFMAILSTGSLACNQKGPVTITSDQYNFPILSIANPGGSDMVITSLSKEKGSIGFERGHAVTWLTGVPEQQTGEKGDNYVWTISKAEKVILNITREYEDIHLHWSLAGTETPPDRWLVNIKAEEDEYFTGIFERVIDGNQDESWKKGITTALNLRGQCIEMQLKPTVSAYAPFYISSNNYGFFNQGAWPGVFDFCRDDAHTVQIAFEGPEFNFTLYRGETPAEIVQKHALETGPSFVPPPWAFGQWRWRDNHYHRAKYYDSTGVKAPYNSDLVEDVLMMKALDIPFSAYWIDRPWAFGDRGFDDYEVDTARLPHFEEMIRWLNQKDIELMMWIAPFVSGKMAYYAEDHNYYLVGKVWKNAHQILIDFTNPEACRWWAENGPGKLARMGVKGFKLDRGDGEKETDSLHLITHKGTSYRENFNDYPRQYVKATYEAVQPVLGDNFVLFPRAQYTGSARYGAMWAGDTRGTHEGLRSAVIAMQRCAVMGYPVWGSDIGGYGRIFSREVCYRWLGFGCFSPIMETGPTTDQGLWNAPGELRYDTSLIAAWRLYSVTRTKLISYIHSLAVEANQTGMPIARPLFLMYPEQEEAWNNWQTYLLGPDILVSVIWKKGETKQQVYLPEGEEWVDAWDTEMVYTGGQYIEVNAPVYKIPVFIRQGANIDLGNLQEIYEESLQIAAKRPNLAELEKAEGWR